MSDAIPFAPDQSAFLQRLAEREQAARQAGAVAKAHLVALENRVASAIAACDLAELGSARAFVEIGQRDMDAALKVLTRATS